jgi:glycosyltransferase involved in cell wall biosynthesis
MIAISKKQTIILLDKELCVGGRQRVVIETAVGLTKQFGHEVIVASKDGVLVDEILKRGIKHELLTGGVLKSAMAVRKLVKKYNASIVHSHCRFHNLTIFIANNLLRTNTRFIATAHNVFPGKHWLCFYPAETICVSPPVEQYVKKVSNSNTHVVLNGMPVKNTIRSSDSVRQEIGIDKDDIVLIHVARLDEQKAQYLLIEAFALYLERTRVSNIKLLIVGDGPLKDRLNNDIDRYKIGDHVFMLGERHDVSDLMAASDIFILSSKWEGLPITLIEAAYSALPMISFDVGGVSQIINNDTGELVGNISAKDLSLAIERLCKDPATREAMGANAKALYLDKFSIEQCVSETNNVYNYLLANA